MADLKKIENMLNRAEAVLAEIRAEIAGDIPAPKAVEPASFDDLKAVLETDRWPVAANKNILCDPESEEDKVQRGRGIIELMVEGELKGKKFLDFGCGEGLSAAYVATKEAALSVGYDIKAQNWDKQKADNLKLVDSWDKVIENGPYDSILVFDVIDHLAEGDTAVEVMEKIKGVLADSGRVYVRTHPFTSRHAIHNYHDLNKGFVHLIFTPEELKKLLPDAKYIEPNNGVKFPLATYKSYFDQAGLEVVTTRPVKDSVEPFFKAPAIADRIMKNLEANQFPEFQLTMAYIDYVLKKSA